VAYIRDSNARDLVLGLAIIVDMNASGTSARFMSQTVLL